MQNFVDVRGRDIRLTDERQEHLETDHPEMSRQIDRVHETLQMPDRIVESRSDPKVELYYRPYEQTPVTQKYLCIVVKHSNGDGFIVAAYYTDTIKKGAALWLKT